MQKIAIATTSFAEYDRTPIELCRQSGYEVLLNPHKRKVEPDELVVFAKDAVGLIAGTESLNEGVLSRLTSLRVISRCGAGLDNVDRAAAKRLGIRVYNTPDAPTLAVAELTVGLILNILRKTAQMDAAIRRGEWKKITGNLLSGKKVGIIGFGRIGRKVAELLKPFRCDIAYDDPHVADSQAGFPRLTKEELLLWADVVTIHVSSAGEIIGEKELSRMKKGSWMVNVSRGGAVNEQALYDSLKNGHLSGAALDVFKKEPYDGPLKKLDNVILTPHIGSYARESRVRMEIETVNNLLKGLEGGSE